MNSKYLLNSVREFWTGPVMSHPKSFLTTQKDQHKPAAKQPRIPETRGGENPKPFLKWAGGKTQLISQISKRMPDNMDSVNTYVEPFIGSGAVMFWIIGHYPNIKKVIINDSNFDLINVYRVLKSRADSLILCLKELSDEYYSLNDTEARKEFYMCRREEYNIRQQEENIRNAALFVFLNHTCFNGLYRVNRKNRFNVPFGHYAHPKIYDEKNLRACHQALRNVEVNCGDFSIMEKYASKKSFYYFDPPYKPLSTTSSFTSYTQKGFDDEEQMRLKDTCDNITSMGAKFMMSNSDPYSVNPDNDFFDKLYDGYQISRVQAKRMINSNGRKRNSVNELLIRNYEK
ncbi:MAG: DNA adenine methylase [Prevotellaceae bacterium]|nr:DNA adenine methylase [Prevotellaceae bacterium]